ncbi:hypothetical protein M8C21_007469 [Ambrosia artemisiifolia]|uniref:YchF C-terminal domain-containing protein n=1 Tax=Ambrosia artemisiifolia TaxID=4212 RepID=A0AAD5G9Q8_AMBAR|nr:hypothetical protein M8C21_007469 [Ambrosia artemisiifolia]
MLMPRLGHNKSCVKPRIHLSRLMRNIAFEQVGVTFSLKLVEGSGTSPEQKKKKDVEERYIEKAIGHWLNTEKEQMRVGLENLLGRYITFLAYETGTGMTAPQATGVFHSDFEKGFTRTKMVSVLDEAAKHKKLT